MSYKITLEHYDENETPRALLHERAISPDAAIALLTAMLAAAPDPPLEEEIVDEVPVTKSKQLAGRPKKVKGQRKCGNCGRPGHMARTCDGIVMGGTPILAPTKLEPATEEQFNLIKATQEEGDMISKDFAKDHDLPIREVNVAIFSKDYETYLSKRENPNAL